MRGAAALALVLGASLATSASAQESALAAAVRLAQEGRFVEALARARSAPEPLARAQAELYVWHHAGALDQALAAGRRGLAVAPADAWLLQNSAYVALSLGAGDEAQRLVGELERALPAEEFTAHAWMRAEADDLVRQRASERAALTRARAVSAAVGLAALVALLLGARRPASR
ncbi:MAG: hypothetical protein H6828_15520 [Planctomycetes bacterium]|nr:hypothetical protein [Planctomycetota bacterium]